MAETVWPASHTSHFTLRMSMASHTSHFTLHMSMASHTSQFNLHMDIDIRKSYWLRYSKSAHVRRNLARRPQTFHSVSFYDRQSSGVNWKVVLLDYTTKKVPTRLSWQSLTRARCVQNMACTSHIYTNTRTESYICTYSRCNFGIIR
jgi:hypothetical protein